MCNYPLVNNEIKKVAKEYHKNNIALVVMEDFWYFCLSCGRKYPDYIVHLYDLLGDVIEKSGDLKWVKDQVINIKSR